MFNEKIVIVLIVLFGFFVRITALSEIPPSLNWDEVSHGYNAYSILTTGRDEWGQTFPIANFRAYGDYPLALNLYLTIPSIAMFGLNEFGIRFPHALLGSLTVIASFFLVLGVTRQTKMSLLASLLVAIEPWYIFPSRFVLQSNLSVFLTTASIALFLNRGKHKFFLPLSFLLLGLTLFSYHSTRIFSPLLLISTFVVYRREFLTWLAKRDGTKIVSLLIIIIFFLPLPFILISTQARARAGWVFLIDQGAVNRIIQQRQTSTLPSEIVRIVYNRPVYFIKEFSQRYLEYFSPNFLFLQGGTQYQFSIPGKGLLYWINLPFFYAGLLLLIKRAIKKEKDYKFMFVWLALSPIPASITQDHFAVIRSTTMLPLPALLTTLGLIGVWDFAKARIENRAKVVGSVLAVLYTAFLFTNAKDYLLQLFTQYPYKYSWAWQYGYKQVVDYVKQNYARYDTVVVTKKYGEPHEFFLFHWPWDPEKYRSDPNLIRFYQSNWYWVDRFDKFYFVNDWEITRAGDRDKEFILESGGRVDCASDSCLLVASPGDVSSGWKHLRTINFLDNKPAFEIYEN